MIKYNELIAEKKDPGLIQKLITDVIANPDELNLSKNKTKTGDYFTVDRTKRGVLTIYKTYWVDGKRHLKYLVDDWKENGTYGQYMANKGIAVKVNDSGVNPDHVWVELEFTQREVADPAQDTLAGPEDGAAPVGDDVELDTQSITPNKEDIVSTLAKMIVDGVAKNKWDAIKQYVDRYGREYIDVIKSIEPTEIGRAVKLARSKGDQV